jgi:hypothetical protein
MERNIGFKPVQRTDKRKGDWEYIWSNGRKVPVRVGEYKTAEAVR